MTKQSEHQKWDEQQRHPTSALRSPIAGVSADCSAGHPLDAHRPSRTTSRSFGIAHCPTLAWAAAQVLLMTGLSSRPVTLDRDPGPDPAAVFPASAAEGNTQPAPCASLAHASAHWCFPFLHTLQPHQASHDGASATRASPICSSRRARRRARTAAATYSPVLSVSLSRLGRLGSPVRAGRGHRLTSTHAAHLSSLLSNAGGTEA